MIIYSVPIGLDISFLMDGKFSDFFFTVHSRYKHSHAGKISTVVVIIIIFF